MPRRCCSPARARTPGRSASRGRRHRRRAACSPRSLRRRVRPSAPRAACRPSIDVAWVPQPRAALPPRRRRHLAAARRAHRAADVPVLPRTRLRHLPEPGRPRALTGAAAAARGRACSGRSWPWTCCCSSCSSRSSCSRCTSSSRSGGRAPRAGRREPRARRDHVHPLHGARLRASCCSASCWSGPAPGTTRPRRARRPRRGRHVAHGPAGRRHRHRRRPRGEGADVAAAHVAAGRAHRRADGRLRAARRACC